MNRNRLPKSAALAAGLILQFAAAGPARANSTALDGLQSPTAASPRAQQNRGSDSVEDDFAGLTYTDEQKAALAKIHQDVESKKAMVAKAQSLNGDQKDAMILGYTRIEYSEMFKVLTTEQQKAVRKRMQTRREADRTTQRKQASHN